MLANPLRHLVSQPQRFGDNQSSIELGDTAFEHRRGKFAFELGTCRRAMKFMDCASTFVHRWAWESKHRGLRCEEKFHSERLERQTKIAFIAYCEVGYHRSVAAQSAADANRIARQMFPIDIHATQSFGVLAICPPSTTMSCPVTHDASSLARNRAAPAISIGSPMRPNGRPAASLSSCSSTM